MIAAHPGHQAIEHIDKALTERPDKNGHELSAALRCLAEFRDGLTAARRKQPGGASDALIEPVNAVISSVLAAQFPLGDIPWKELEKARDWLVDVVQRCEATAS